jgi:hypothetical protein
LKKQHNYMARLTAFIGLQKSVDLLLGNPARCHLHKTTSSEERSIMAKGQDDEAVIREIARRAFEAERKMATWTG